MAMLIIFTIFGLFWLGTTLASITYFVFKNSKSLTQTLENHSPFWLQDYYTFLNRYHKPLLIGSIVMGIGLTVWGIDSQEEQYSCTAATSERCKKNHNYQEPESITRLETKHVQIFATPYGGTENLYRYFEQNKNNPTGETGTIYVQFFVQEDGSLADISVISSISPTLDNEAIRLIEEYSEGWQPALYHGRAVEQRVVIPIQF